MSEFNEGTPAEISEMGVLAVLYESLKNRSNELIHKSKAAELLSISTKTIERMGEDKQISISENGYIRRLEIEKIIQEGTP